MEPASSLDFEGRRGPHFGPEIRASGLLQAVTTIALALMIVRFTVGMVAEPFYPSICNWTYRLAVVLLIPGFSVAILRPSSVVPLAIAGFGLCIAGARLYDGDRLGTYLPVLVGIFAGVSATTIRGPVALRALCGTFVALPILTALLILFGDLSTEGFRERLGYGWSAAHARDMRSALDAPPVFNPNEVAFPVAISLSIALLPVAAGSGFALRATRWITTACAVLLLIATASRGMAVAGMAGFLVSLRADVAAKRSLAVGAVTITIVLTLAASVVFLPIGLLKDPPLRSDLSGNLLTFGDRTTIWDASIDRLSRHPVLGAGRDLFGGDVISPHNALISAGELAGGVGIGAISALIFVCAFRMRHSAPFGAPASICVLAAGGSIDTLAHPLAWVIVGVACSSASTAVHRCVDLSVGRTARELGR